MAEFHLTQQPPLIPAWDISQLSKEADPCLPAPLRSPFSALCGLAQALDPFPPVPSPALRRHPTSDPALARPGASAHRPAAPPPAPPPVISSQWQGPAPAPPPPRASALARQDRPEPGHPVLPSPAAWVSQVGFPPCPGRALMGGDNARGPWGGGRSPALALSPGSLAACLADNWVSGKPLPQ